MKGSYGNNLNGKEKRRLNRKAARAKKKQLIKNGGLKKDVKFGSLEFYKGLWKKWKFMNKKYKLMLLALFCFGNIILLLGPLKGPSYSAGKQTISFVYNTFDFRPWFKAVFEPVKEIVQAWYSAIQSYLKWWLGLLILPLFAYTIGIDVLLKWTAA